MKKVVHTEGLHNQDHLGNNREVIGTRGAVRQVTNYYPFGTPFTETADIINPDAQPYKYNGKELDRMHGLDTYDYGARQYYPILGRWDRMDPLCEKYYGISPYAYCANNPVNAIDEEGSLTLFVNGWHLGFEGGLSTYWGSFDNKIKEHFNDTKCRYYDGSFGGVMTLINIFRVVRDGVGYLDGLKDAPSIIKSLARNKDGKIIEKLRIVSHSMGGAYAKGLIRAIIHYAKNHPELCEGLSIDEYDFAPYQSEDLEAIDGVETFQYSHINDGVAHNKREKGNVHYMQTSKEEDDGHSIQSFIQYIYNLQEGNYKFVNGQFIKEE